MANALRPEVQRSPYRLGPGVLASMNRQPESLIRCIGILLAKKFWRAFLLVAANANADHIAITVFCRQLENRLGFLRAKLSDGVENPQQGHAEVFFAAPAPALQSFENRAKV